LTTLTAPGTRPAPCRVEAFAPACRDPRPAWLPVGVVYRRMWVPGRLHHAVRRHLRLPVETLHQLQHAELIHTLNPEPIHTKLPWVTTVHDVSWRHFREQHGSWISRQYACAAEEAIRSADHICADSHVTAQDLIAGGCPAHRISVARLGVEDRFRHLTAADVVRVRKRFDLPDRFVLYVGLVNLRKNVGVLARALQSLRNALPLVIAGPPPPEGLASWGIDPSVTRHLGFVPEEEIPALYGAAAVMVFPSLSEGFGLPLLEAMATGAPVVASRIPVFREIAGDVPFYFDPTDSEALRAALQRLLLDRDLRIEMRQRGIERAAAFTWEACAAATLHAYERALRC
jgi:glycosyltransferase involved in cell wall biosynthesis